MIQANHLQKRFDAKVAVDDVSFHAANGRITGLLGPNGAGKTTSLRMLYGLVQPDDGTVTIDGLEAASEPTVALQRLGVLPDAPGLYTRLTAREHLRYAGQLQGLGGEALELTIEKLLDLLDMREIADRRARGFSQGERRKVALARALVHDPPNLVLDEPSGGLDVMSARALRQVIRGLADAGKCILFSSHVMQEVSALCDRVVIVAQGRVVADGSPNELLEATGHDDLETAFIDLIGTEEGIR